MCGRYALFTAPDELEKYFEAIISNMGSIQPNYNVTPGMLMPVVLRRNDVREWLHPDTGSDVLTGLMKPLPDELTEVYRVSDEVNKPANNHAGLLDKSDDEGPGNDQNPNPTLGL